MAGPSMSPLEVKYVLDAVQNGWYGDNAYTYVERFEQEFAAYHGRKYGLMTSNCTSSIHLLLAGLGVTAGDEVIVPECTWIGSSAAIKYQRANTVFADIDSKHWCLTPESIAKVITAKTKAIIVVDLFGNMPDWEKLQELANKHNIFLIEDAAEALGSTLNGTKAGKFGIGSTFSFHRTKTITTGEGGMLLLDDDKLFERCRFLRDHGRQPGTYYNTEVAFKYMPFNVQAALGYAQFNRIDELVSKKRYILNGYKERLSNIPDLYFNPEPEEGVNGAWATALVFGSSHQMNRDTALSALSKLDIPARPFFYPLSSLPAYKDISEDAHIRNPVAYLTSEHGINLPCALDLTDDHLDVIASGIKTILRF